MEQIEQLKKLGKIFNSDKLVTSDDIQQVLSGILGILATFKKETETINAETKEVVLSILDTIQDKYKELDKLADESISKKKENILNDVTDVKEQLNNEIANIDEKLKEVTDFLKEVKAIKIKKPKDGKDGQSVDKDEVIADVLSAIKLPEYEVFNLEEKGEQIVNEINALPLEDEYKIDAKHIKNIPVTMATAGPHYLAGDNISIEGNVISSTSSGSALTVQDIDGNPTATNVNTIKFTNGSVTDDGAGVVTVTTGSGGGGDVSSNTATSVDSEVVLFSGTGGKTIKRATGTGLAKLTSGVLGVATPGTDYASAGAITSSGLTMATARLLGRTTASTGAVEEITVGTGLSLSGGTLSATGGSAVWGAITGTLSDQTDLNTALSGKLGTSLTSANIFVGNGSNVATGVAMSGDITIDNAGATAIGANKVTDAMIRQSGARSVIGRSAATTGDVADISASTAGHILRRSGTTIGFGSIDLSLSAAVGTSRLAYANIAQGSGLSVLGVTGTSSANVASIVGTASTVLSVNAGGTALDFSKIELAMLSATGTPSGSTYLRGDNTWATISSSGSPLTTKGDIFTYDTADARLGVGTDGYVLTADSSTSTGLAWAAVSGTGTVTSVAMSVPTGLTISGSPITTSGTLAVGLDTGYVIPLQTTIDGKANVALNNLASVAINTSLISDTNNTDDLGSSSITWRTGYFGTSVVTPAVSGTSTITGVTGGLTITTVTNGAITVSPHGSGKATVTAGSGGVDITTTAGNSNINITPHGSGINILKNAQVTALTASKVVFTDASKNLTSTGIGTSSQFIKGDGSLDSSTYLTSAVTSVATGTGLTGGTITTTGTVSLSTPLQPIASLAGNAGLFLRVNAGETAVEYASVSGSGTVTSVAMTVPTGLTISGSPITTSGTLAVGLDTGYEIPLSSTISGKADKSGALTQFVGNGNWKVWYSDGSGDVQELALGSSGTYLKSNGASNAPTFDTPSGSGTVTSIATAGLISGGTITTTGTITTSMNTNKLVGRGTSGTGVMEEITLGTGLSLSGTTLNASGGGLTNFTEAAHTSSPNNTVNVSSLTVVASSTNADFVIAPKGTGGILAQVPDSGTGGGNKRGAGSVDLQTLRASAIHVASGARAGVLSGERNRASGDWSISGGYNVANGGSASVGLGESHVITGLGSAVLGSGHDVSTDYCFATGRANAITGLYGQAHGYQAVASLYGEVSYGATRYSANGDNQYSYLSPYRIITGTSAANLFLNGSSSRLILPATNRVWSFTIDIVAVCTTSGGTVTANDVFKGTYSGLIKRVGSTTSIVDTVDTLVTKNNTSMASPTVAITADDTNEALDIQWTNPAGSNGSTACRVSCKVQLVEIGW